MKMYHFKPHVFVILIAFVISILSYTDSYGQQAETSDSDLDYWIHTGSSISTLGVGVQGGLTFDYNRHVFSLRTTSTDPTLMTDTWDIAFLYGRSVTFHSFYFSAGVGASVVGGKKYSRLLGSENASEVETTLGFPLEGQLLWTPIRFLSLGIYSFANVNTEQPFGGIGLNIRLGNLK